VRDQCIEFGIPFFFKQWGVFAPDESGERLVKLRRKHDRLLDGRTWDEFPERRIG
jgi:protein gp37